MVLLSGQMSPSESLCSRQAFPSSERSRGAETPAPSGAHGKGRHPPPTPAPRARTPPPPAPSRPVPHGPQPTWQKQRLSAAPGGPQGTTGRSRTASPSALSSNPLPAAISPSRRHRRRLRRLKKPPRAPPLAGGAAAAGYAPHRTQPRPGPAGCPVAEGRPGPRRR